MAKKSMDPLGLAITWKAKADKELKEEGLDFSYNQHQCIEAFLMTLGITPSTYSDDSNIPEFMRETQRGERFAIDLIKCGYDPKLLAIGYTMNSEKFEDALWRSYGRKKGRCDFVDGNWKQYKTVNEYYDILEKRHSGIYTFDRLVDGTLRGRINVVSDIRLGLGLQDLIIKHGLNSQNNKKAINRMSMREIREHPDDWIVYYAPEISEKYSIQQGLNFLDEIAAN